MGSLRSELANLPEVSEMLNTARVSNTDAATDPNTNNNRVIDPNVDPRGEIDSVEISQLLYPPFRNLGLETDPVAIVIDGPNFYHFTKELGLNIDYKWLSKVLYANFPNIRNKYYITSEHVKKNHTNTYKEGHSPIRGLLEFLRYSRWTVVKRTIEITDESKPVDSTMDVEIVCTLFEASEWAKHIIFFGASKKFVMPLTMLRKKGITITVVATTKTDPRFMADELRKIDNFVEIDAEFFRFWINNDQNRRTLTNIPGVGQLQREQN